MSKSYVTMEQRLCSCCGKEYETNSILLDTKMRERFDMLTTTGYGQCNKCKKEGYVTMVECDPEKSKRTGSTLHSSISEQEKLSTLEKKYSNRYSM